MSLMFSENTLLLMEDFQRVGNRLDQHRRVAEIRELLGLPAEAAMGFPHEFSDGQRQHSAIAEATNHEQI